MLLAGFSFLWAVGLKSVFFTGCWAETTLVSLPRGSLHKEAHSVSASFHEREQVRGVRGREKERERERYDHFLYLHLRSNTLSRHFIPFIRSKLLGPVHTQGRALDVMNTRRWAISEAVYRESIPSVAHRAYLRGRPPAWI